MPLLSLSYKYFLLRHSFSTSSFYIPKPIFLAAASFEKLKNSSESLSQQFFESSIFFLSRKKWPSTSSSLRSILSNLLFLLPYFYLMQIYLLSIFFPLPFSVLPTFKPLGIGRENCYSYRATPPSMPRSIGKSRSYRSDQCRNK